MTGPSNTPAAPYSVTLDLASGDRYAILVNALQDYASMALDNANDAASDVERDDFRATAATAQELLREVTGD